MRVLTAALDDPTVAAAQGYYATDPGAPIPARVMGLDLEQRYASIADGDTDHVCTGNAAYRVEALHRVGLFDESLGYGYDNDMRDVLRTDAEANELFADVIGRSEEVSDLPAEAAHEMSRRVLASASGPRISRS